MLYLSNEIIANLKFVAVFYYSVNLNDVFTRWFYKFDKHFWKYKLAK